MVWWDLLWVFEIAKKCLQSLECPLLAHECIFSRLPSCHLFFNFLEVIVYALADVFLDDCAAGVQLVLNFSPLFNRSLLR